MLRTVLARRKRRTLPTDLRAAARLAIRRQQQRDALPSKRLQHAQRMLHKAQRRAALAQTVVKRWQRRCRLYASLLKRHQDHQERNNQP